MSDYSRWYKDGDATVTNGSKTVTGTGTYWKTAGIKAGDMLTVDGGSSFKEIASVNSDTSITLAANYTGSTASKVDYAIVRNFTSGTVAEVASQVSDLLGDFKRYISTDMEKLNGKSAYEIAKDNGYTGSESQWLEDLKAAGEWSALNARTNILNFHNGAMHNAFYYPANLGTAITAEQHAAISNETFEGIYPGSFWNLGSGYLLKVLDCNMFCGYDTWDTTMINNHVVCLVINNKGSQMMTEDNTITGGLLNTHVYTDVMPEILSDLEGLIGSEHILSLPKTHIASAVDNATGLVTAWTQKENERIFLMTAGNMYGVQTGHSLYYGLQRQFSMFRYTSLIASGTVAYEPWLAEVCHYTISNLAGWCYAHASATGRAIVEGWYKSGTTKTKPVLPYILLN